MKVFDSPFICYCGLDAESIDHFLFDCQIFDKQRSPWKQIVQIHCSYPLSRPKPLSPKPFIPSTNRLIKMSNFPPFLSFEFISNFNILSVSKIFLSAQKLVALMAVGILPHILHI